MLIVISSFMGGERQRAFHRQPCFTSAAPPHRRKPKRRKSNSALGMHANSLNRYKHRYFRTYRTNRTAVFHILCRNGNLDTRLVTDGAIVDVKCCNPGLKEASRILGALNANHRNTGSSCGFMQQHHDAHLHHYGRCAAAYLDDISTSWRCTPTDIALLVLL